MDERRSDDILTLDKLVSFHNASRINNSYLS